MAKKKRQKTPREVTKRQLSRWQQQKKRQRIIAGIGIFIIAAVLGTIGGGWYMSQYRPLHETVITVNDTSFNMDYYVNTLEYYGKDQPSMSLYNMASEVTRIIEESELVRQGAMKLGISISDDELKEELKEHGIPSSKVARDSVRTELLLIKLLDEYFEQQVPVYAAQSHVLAIFLESESQSLEVTSRLEAGEDFSDLAGELSLDGLTKDEEGDLGWRVRDILVELLNSPMPDEYISGAEVRVLSQPLYDEAKVKAVGYWLFKILERKEGTEEVHVQVMQLGSREQADKVRARLEAGEDFAELAGEFSQLEGAEENGGDVGNLSPGIMSSEIDEFVFDPEIALGTISEPIRDDKALTTGGYWLVKVLDKEDNRKIEDMDRAFLKDKALREWISSLWNDPENKVEDFLDNEKIGWAIDWVTRS